MGGANIDAMNAGLVGARAGKTPQELAEEVATAYTSVIEFVGGVPDDLHREARHRRRPQGRAARRPDDADGGPARPRTPLQRVQLGVLRVNPAEQPLLPAALGVIASTPTTLRGLMGGLPEDVTSAPGEEGWSPKDVLAHVLSVHGPALVERVRLIAEQDNPPIPNVDEQAVLERSGLRARPVGALLDEFARERAEAVAWMRALAPEALSRTGRHSIAGDVSAADIIHHVAWHDLLHVEQVCRMLAAPLHERRGAMRQFT